jgi:outer membrane protein TolC
VDVKRHNIEITKNSRRAAKRFLTQELMNYEAGEGDVEKLISALTTFIEQRSLYLSALHDYRVGLVRLQLAVGASNMLDLVEQENTAL